MNSEIDIFIINCEANFGTNDVLFNDSTQIEQCFKDAGVDVDLKIWEDMWHVWHIFGERLPEAKQAIDEIGVFIKENLDINK